MSSLLAGSDLPSLEVQHHVCYQNSRGASEPLRAAQNAGWSPQSQQELPLTYNQGTAGGSWIRWFPEVPSSLNCSVILCMWLFPARAGGSLWAELQNNPFFTIAYVCCGSFRAVSVDLINYVEIAEKCKSSRKTPTLLCQGSSFLQSPAALPAGKGSGSFSWGVLTPTSAFKADPSSGLSGSCEQGGLPAESLSSLPGGRVWGARDPGNRRAVPGLCDARSAEDVFRD